MTEDEAKTKWCFHFIASHTNPRQREWEEADHAPATSNPEPTGPFIHRCIASACMAWRVRRQWFDNAQQEPDWVSYPPYGFEPGPGQERDDGFCGLAVEPR